VSVCSPEAGRRDRTIALDVDPYHRLSYVGGDSSLSRNSSTSRGTTTSEIEVVWISAPAPVRSGGGSADAVERLLELEVPARRRLRVRWIIASLCPPIPGLVRLSQLRREPVGARVLGRNVGGSPEQSGLIAAFARAGESIRRDDVTRGCILITWVGRVKGRRYRGIGVRGNVRISKKR